MDTSKGFNRALCLSFAVATLVVAGCANDHPGQPSSAAWADKQTTSRVKSALKDSPTYKYPSVNVTTYDGMVSLSGFVNTEPQKKAASDIASGVPGVRSVIDNLVVKFEPTGRAPVMETNMKVNPQSLHPGLTNAEPVSPQNTPQNPNP